MILCHSCNQQADLIPQSHLFLTDIHGGSGVGGSSIYGDTFEGTRYRFTTTASLYTDTMTLKVLIFSPIYYL